MKEFDISNEAYREYDYPGRMGEDAYRIVNPVTLYYYKGATTRRVVDQAGVTHCVPAPGFNGCALRWKGKNGKAVDF